MFAVRGSRETHAERVEKTVNPKVKRTLGLGLFLLICCVVVAALFFPAMNHPPGAVVKTQVILSSLVTASKAYHVEYQQWPKSLDDLTDNPKKMLFIDWTRGEENKDGWQHPIIYVPYNESVGYGSVISYGRDGKLGGKGADEDIEVRFN
jgi:hypothetical protein